MKKNLLFITMFWTHIISASESVCGSTFPMGILDYSKTGFETTITSPLIIEGVVNTISKDTTSVVFYQSEGNIFLHSGYPYLPPIDTSWFRSEAKEIALTSPSIEQDSSLFFLDSNQYPISTDMLEVAQTYKTFFVPFDINLIEGDSISITNYTAHVIPWCDSGGARYTGVYKIFRNGIEVDQFAQDTTTAILLPDLEQNENLKQSTWGYDLQGRKRIKGRQQIILIEP